MKLLSIYQMDDGKYHAVFQEYYGAGTVELIYTDLDILIKDIQEHFKGE